MSSSDISGDLFQAISSAAEAESASPGIQLQIPHDLAVQLVGSDAGKAKRFKPHSAVTKGAPLEEIDALAAFMQPFLEREIDRVHLRITRGSRGHAGLASREQAVALKSCCQRLAASQRSHLEKHPDDDRLSRTRQRLHQTLDVIRQINIGLGIENETIEPWESRINGVVGRLQRLETDLREIAVNLDGQAGSDAADRSSVTALISLLAPISRALQTFTSHDQ